MMNQKFMGTQRLLSNVSENFKSIISQNDSINNRVSHGTSPKQIHRAFKTYLNITGAGDYNLPTKFGSTSRESLKKNQPVYTFKGSDRTKLTWFPQRHVDFVGRDAPPSTSYSPDSKIKEKNPIQFSIGKRPRFLIPS